MARAKNSLFTSPDLMTIEGRNIKHVGLITEWNTPNINTKISDIPIDFVGTDLETNSETAELKLLGLWNGKEYFKYEGDFISKLFSIIKYCDHSNKTLAYWNKLDPFVLFKQFVNELPPESQKRAMGRYGKIGGKWNRREKKWKITPLVELKINNTPYKFGIKNVIRSSIQFFIRKDGEMLNTVWAYDIAPLYKDRLEKVMSQYKEKYPYYSKIDKSAHIVDWDRYETDENYRINIVQKSNMFDARAVYDLANNIQEQFKTAFGAYSRSLISTGSLARSAVVATIISKYASRKNLTAKQKQSMAWADLKAISIKPHFDAWSEQVEEAHIKDFACLTTEAYSAGYIEAIEYGNIGTAYYADLAGAYHAVIKGLWDLRGSILTRGEGEPPHIKNSYCLIRGMVDIPSSVDFHPITVKHMTNLETNVRGVGIYKASYTINERDDLIALGATFKNEVWYNVETKGEPSPIAETIESFIKLRTRLIKENDVAQYMAKITSSSCYGILYEANEEYLENNSLEVERVGYNAGEFLNTLYACYITSEVRRKMAKNANYIVRQGGKVILVMTDALFWSGTPEMLDPESQRDIKTTGFFEPPVKIENFVSLGTGRYSYTDSGEGFVTTKNRGLNIKEIHSDEGVDVTTYNWIEALGIAERNDSLKIEVTVRTLISVGMVAHNSAYSISELGLITDEYRKVDLITGLTKRILKEEINDVRQITRGSVGTKSLYFDTGMFQDGEIYDQTLPKLREAVMKQSYFTAKGKDLQNRSKASMKYAKANAEGINKILRNKYNMLKDLGYTRNDAKRMQKWSWERINETIMNNSDIKTNKKKEK